MGFVPIAPVVIEILKLAISPGVLPLTILLVLMGVFWMTCLLGALDFDIFTFDGGEGGFDSGDGRGLASGSMRWLVRYLNGDVVPLAAVMSLLLIYQWCAVMLGHHFRPPGRDTGAILLLHGIGIVPAFFLTSFSTRLMRPLFAALQGTEGEAKPVVGRGGRVRSGVCDEHAGQVELDDPESPLLVNARVAEGCPPITRGTRITVVGHDSLRDFYLVTSHSEQP
jgi:hypothetical protein